AIAIYIRDEDWQARPAAPAFGRAVGSEVVIGVPDPRLFGRTRRRLEPAARRNHIVAAVAVDIADAATVAHPDVLRPERVLAEPRSLVDVLEPDQAPAGLPGEVVHQHVLAVMASQVPGHRAFDAVGLNQRVRLPFHPGLTRVFVPPDALTKHPARADDVHSAVVIDVERGFVVVVHVRTVRLRAIAIIRMLGPVWREVVIPPGRNVQFAVAVNVQDGGALRERTEPVSVPRRIVHGAVDLDDVEHEFPGRRRLFFGGRTAGRARDEQTDAGANR